MRIIIVVFVMLCFTLGGCSRVDFTFMGFYNVTYKSKPKEKIDIPQEDPNAVLVSGFITDNSSQPADSIELFLIKSSKVEYHAVTIKGNYSMRVKPDTYDFFLIDPKTSEKKIVNSILLDKQDNRQNISF